METEEQKKARILAQLKQKIKEIEKLKEELGEPHFPKNASPDEAKELIEEIKVPDLKVLKDRKKQVEKEKTKNA